jgi:beta-glucosidase
LYPFGYGLTYANISYDAIRAPSSVDACASVDVSIQISNSGAVGTDEVVQLYAQWGGAPYPTPLIQLVGFERVHIPAGQTAVATLLLGPRQWGVVDDDGGEVVAALTLRLTAASSSDLRGGAIADVQLTGPQRLRRSC